MPTSTASQKPPLYRRVLHDAARIVWQHKHLWIFGFFAGIWTTRGMLMQYGVNRVPIMYQLMNARDGVSGFVPGMPYMRDLARLSPHPILSVGIWLLCMLAIISIVVWVSVLSYGALVGSIKKITLGGDLHFSEGASIGKKNFWKMLGIYVVTKFAAGIAIIVLMAFALNAGFVHTGVVRNISPGLGLLLALPLILLAAVVAYVAELVGIYAANFAVIQNKSIGESLRLGLNLFREQWLISLEMTLALFVIEIGFCFGIGILASILAVPLIFFMTLALAISSASLFFSMMFAGLLVLIGVVIAMTATLSTFKIAAWTLLWNELVTSTPLAKLLRWFRR